MPSKPFDSVDAASLRWMRRSESELQFDLLAGDEPVASMAWKAGSGTVTTAGSAWTVRRAGFLNPTVVVHPEGSEKVVARLSVHWHVHRIEVTGGPVYRFHRAGLLLPAWQVTTEDGREILHIEPVREGRRLVGGAVIAPPEVPRLPEFPLLLAISWCFIVLAWFEDEALVPLEGDDAPAGAGTRAA